MNEKEIQSRLSEIESIRVKLRKEEIELNEKLDSQYQIYDFKVGDIVRCSNGDSGEVISVNGPENFPIIVLIHRTDTGVDDVSFFDYYGILLGYNRTFTIYKKQ